MTRARILLIESTAAEGEVNQQPRGLGASFSFSPNAKYVNGDVERTELSLR